MSRSKTKKFIDAYVLELKRCLDSISRNDIEKAISLIVEAYKKRGKIFILGNGGGASTASHMACDLGKGTLQRICDNTEKRLQVISLVDNAALLTAFGNDLSFDDIFIQQLRNLVVAGDVVIVHSGSGNSSNIVKALEYAKKCGAKTIGFLGFKTGGKAGKMVDCAVIVDSNHYGPVEDIQLIINHIITSWIAKNKNYHDGNINSANENKAVPFNDKENKYEK